MFDSSLEPGSRIEAVYKIWVVFKKVVPDAMAIDMERVIGQAIDLLPFVARVQVIHDEGQVEEGRVKTVPLLPTTIPPKDVL